SGALQIGVLVSYLLFEVTTAQTYIYYHRFPYDSPRLKTLSTYNRVCECAHAICIGHGLYIYTITNCGQPERLAYALPRSILVGGLLTTVIAVFGFFAFQIYFFTKKLYIFLIISVMIFLRVLAGSAVSFVGMVMTLLGPFEKHWGWIFYVMWTIGVANDLKIA
ncbi:hypothetical protein DFH08DRAFT_651586, partial [Mycena albidolilacea]